MTGICWGALAIAAAAITPRAAALHTDRPSTLIIPGPPAVAWVFQVQGGRVTLLGPPLLYRHRGKMASALDIDGDSRLDLLLLVHKTTRFDPVPGWRPFVYTLREGRWAPKWLGSRVGHPLLEASFVRTPAGPRLLTIESFAPGAAGLTLYRWRGFGFWGEWTGPPLGPVSGLTVADLDGDGIDEIAVRAAGGAPIHFAHSGEGYALIPDRGGEEKR
jgi:hypothetical protein